MSDYYLEPRNIQERFTMKVDWDIDVDSTDGCHGTDLLFRDDPVEIPFTVYKNGEVFVEWGDPDEESKHNKTYILSADGTLYTNTLPPSDFIDVFIPKHSSVLLRKAMEIPTMDRPVACSAFDHSCQYEPGFSADNEFLSCYQESANLNLHLTAPQKAVVERFFASVRQTFPQQFASR